MSRWIAPPDRREVFLSLFAIAIFLIGYNFENSGQLIQNIGWANKPIGPDGSRSSVNDPLEHKIAGDWKWDDDHVLGHLRESGQAKGVGSHGAFWQAHDTVPHPGSEKPVSQAVLPFDKVPSTSLVKHVPGHTVIDNVILFAGRMFIVTDYPGQFPELSDMVSSPGQGSFTDWQIISTQTAKEMFPAFVASVDGVTFISAEPDPDDVSNTTLLSLWRTYASLDPFISSTGQTTLPAPTRYLWPHRRFFTDANPTEWDDDRRRRRMDIGIHHFNLKVSWPFLGLGYYEDWEDWALMDAPFVFQRVVIVDPASSRNHEVRYDGLGQKSQWWFEPIRKGVKDFFALAPSTMSTKPKKNKKKIVYLHVQDDSNAAIELTPSTHDALVSSLHSLPSSSADVKILSTSDFSTPWKERMAHILSADLVLGVHGPHLLDFAYMDPEAGRHVIELFPGNRFDFEYGNVARELGMNWVGWLGTQRITAIDTLPSSYERPSQGQKADIDVAAVLSDVRKLLQV